MSKLKVFTDKKRFGIAPDLYGLFFEDINRAGDGGLYPEMIRNRSFEDSILPDDCVLDEKGRAFVNDSGWTDVFNNGEGLDSWIRDNKTAYTPIPAWYTADGAAIAMNSTDVLNSKRLAALDVDFGAGYIYNAGYVGMQQEKGCAYTFYMFAKNVEGDGKVTVAFESGDGKTCDEKTFTLASGGYVRYDAVFVGQTNDYSGRLKISGSGKIRLGFISLMPADTYNGHGLRTDIVEFYKGIDPSFVRFPGGCIVEGFTYGTMNYFRNCIGPVWERPSQPSLWHYRMTNGLGFHEFLQLCEDLDAKALYVCNCGIVCQGRSHQFLSGDKLQDMLDDAIAAIEYANAPADTKYGAMRAAAGHPQPFELKYIEIGNENFGPIYNERYKFFYDELKKRYPDMIFVANTHLENDGLETDIVDEHFYSDVNFFAEELHHYDGYDRKGPGIFVGELAVNAGHSGTQRAAVSEAMFFVGLERNQDIVKLASYAPLTQNIHYPSWFPNLIAFDNYRSYGIPSYYVWKLFGHKRGENVLTIEEEPEFVTRPVYGTPALLGSSGLKFRGAKYNGEPIVPTHDLLGYTKADGDAFTTSEGTEDQASERMLSRMGIAGEVCIVLGSDENEKDTAGKFQIDILPESGKTIAIGAYSGRAPSSYFDLVAEREKKDWEYRSVHPFRWEIRDGVSRVVDTSRRRMTPLCEDAEVKLREGEYNTFAFEADGKTVRVYINGEFIQEAVLPTRQKSAASATDTADEVVIKLVNFSELAEDVDIALDCEVESEYTLDYIAADADTMNTIDEPKNVCDMTKVCTGAAKEFAFHAEPYSVNVITLKKVK